ncbi:MAG: hypothetical protein JF614_26320 [Acidobacteria bacterium]|nr:hypothetical protein [Acidobacteriota bacterium]
MTEKTLSTPRKLVVALGLTCALALTVLATTPRTAEAASNQDCTYFNDDSHSQVVGQRGVDCCGASIDRGVTSPYFTCEPVPVCIWCPPSS